MRNLMAALTVAFLTVPVLAGCASEAEQTAKDCTEAGGKPLVLEVSSPFGGGKLVENSLTKAEFSAGKTQIDGLCARTKATYVLVLTFQKSQEAEIRFIVDKESNETDLVRANYAFGSDPNTWFAVIGGHFTKKASEPTLFIEVL